MSRILIPASPIGTRDPTGPLAAPSSSPKRKIFYIGAARPTIVSKAFQVKADDGAVLQPIAKGRDLTMVSHCEKSFLIRAQAPWFVTVNFDWRARQVRIPWPRRAVDVFGLPRETDTENDWLLLSAAFQGAARARDSSLIEDFREEYSREVASGLLVVGAVLAGGFVLYRLTTKGGKPS